MTHRAPIFL